MLSFQSFGSSGHTYVRLYGEHSGVGIYKITNNDSGLQVAPNPASGNLSVSFNLHEQSSILISLTDSRGHEMALLQKDHLNSGVQQFNLDVSRFAPGLYLLTLKSTDNGRLIGSEKVILR